MNRFVGLAFAGAAIAGGCDEPLQGPCTPNRMDGLVIFVVANQTNAQVCNAMVTAGDGTYTETLRRADAHGGGCRYQGASERAGTYSVRAEAAGFHPALVPSVHVRLTTDGCHVEPARVTIPLLPGAPE